MPWTSRHLAAPSCGPPAVPPSTGSCESANSLRRMRFPSLRPGRPLAKTSNAAGTSFTGSTTGPFSSLAPRPAFRDGLPRLLGAIRLPLHRYQSYALRRPYSITGRPCLQLQPGRTAPPLYLHRRRAGPPPPGWLHSRHSWALISHRRGYATGSGRLPRSHHQAGWPLAI